MENFTAKTHESSDLFKSKRNEFTVEIRKKKTEELINHKRFKYLEKSDDDKAFDQIIAVSQYVTASSSKYYRTRMQSTL